MKILTLDATDWNCSAALWHEGCELAFQEKNSERDQAAHLPQLVREVMGRHEVDQLIVNIGPGSFTGIRVGLAFAKGLCMSSGLSLKGIDSFTATYLSLEPTNKDVLILIEARRQDFFGQRFLNGIPQAPKNLMREDIEKLLSTSNPPLLAGSGVSSFLEGRGVSSFLEGRSYDEAFSPWRGAQKLAHAFFKNPLITVEPLPFYIREADVTHSSRSCISVL